MLKKIIIFYVLAAVLVGAVTTALQVQPALFFIELLTGDDNKFPLTLTALLTILALLLPALILLLFVQRALSKSSGQKSPPDLTGKTGLLIHRERALYDGLYSNSILINGEKKGAVSNGKFQLVELNPDTYKVFIKGNTNQSEVLVITLQHNQVIQLVTGYENEGFKSHLFLRHHST